MNKELELFIDSLIKNILQGYAACIRGDVSQIGNYHGTKLLLTEARFNGAQIVTIAKYQHGNYAHLLFLDRTVRDIKEDYDKKGKKKILPKVIFKLKMSEGRVVGKKLQSQSLDKIDFGEFSPAFMNCFLKAMKLVYAA